MIEEYQIRILPEQAASEEGIKRYLAKEKGLDVRTLNQVRVLKRSIDARQRTIFVNLKVRVAQVPIATANSIPAARNVVAWIRY